VTLPIHVWYEQQVILIRSSKEHVWVEHDSGELRILPKTWTSFLPQSDPPKIDEQLVRLDLLGILDLSQWILARKNHNRGSNGSGKTVRSKKKAHLTKEKKRQDEQISKRTIARSRKVVEQTGSSNDLRRRKKHSTSTTPRRSKT
jgi:hypothetical protein